MAYVLGGLDENFNTICVIVTEKMLSEHVTIDDVKAFLLIHKRKLESRKVLNISPLPSMNMSVKNYAPPFNPNGFCGISTPSDNHFASITHHIGNINIDNNQNFVLHQRPSQYQGNSINRGN